MRYRATDTESAGPNGNGDNVFKPDYESGQPRHVATVCSLCNIKSYLYVSSNVESLFQRLLVALPAALTMKTY